MSARYIPALSFRCLSPLYDPLHQWDMHEEAFMSRLIWQMGIQQATGCIGVDDI